MIVRPLTEGALDDDIDIRQSAERHQLPDRERTLPGAAPGQDDDLTNRAAAQLVQRMLGNIGRAQGCLVQDEDPCDVQRDIAVADDHRPLRVQRERGLGVIGMAVVPVDEIGGGNAAG